MNDRDNREVPVVPEQPSEHIKHLELLLPNMEWQQDRATVYHLTPQKEAKYKAMSEKLAQSSRVIVVMGMWGLGDTIIETRFAINLARQTGKQVVCQVPGGLLPFADRLRQAFPNIQLVDKVPQQFLADQQTVVMRFLGGGGGIREVERWCEGDPQTNSEVMKKKIEEGQAMELEDFTVPEITDTPGTFPDPFAPVQHQMGKFNTLSYTAGFVTQSLGIPATAEDIRDTSLVSFSKEEVEGVPQDLDLVIIPDAKEFPDEKNFQSYKALDPRMWELILDQLPRNQKIGIVMGVSHPDYCQAIINSAEKLGHQVEVISGNLEQLARQLLRAKKVVGMDSGTTHLAKDVQTAARKAGRSIELKPLFNEEISHFEQYGIAETTSFTYTKETRRVANEMAQFILS